MKDIITSICLVLLSISCLTARSHIKDLRQETMVLKQETSELKNRLDILCVEVKE